MFLRQYQLAKTCPACGGSRLNAHALAVRVGGETIAETVEGLHGDGGLHPIQDAFVEKHGLQCGFCTPGFLMSTLELLRETPDPSDAEIREAIGGNLCRCTGYQNILESVRAAAVKMRARDSIAPPLV